MSAVVSAVVSAAVLSGCGERPDDWDKNVRVTQTTALESSIAFLDEPARRLTMVSVSKDGLETRHREVGTNVATMAASPDGSKLFVLAQGVFPRTSTDDEQPGLWVYDGAGSRDLTDLYPLDAPLDGLTVDPFGKFVIVHAQDNSRGFVQNPNELILVDITQPPSSSNPTQRTLRSYGGAPKRLTFTKPLDLPAGPKRLLIVETDQEVSLLDLDHLDRPEVTVLLNSSTGSANVRPVEVAIDEGDPALNDDTRIAIRTNQAQVYVLTLRALSPGKQSPNDYEVDVNMAGLGSVPTGFSFVRTNAGLRIAVLEPSKSRATLIDPVSTDTTIVDLSQQYGSMALVTDVAGGDSSIGDIAMLWAGSGSAKGVALWSLVNSVTQPYRSIEQLSGVATTIKEVLDVPHTGGTLKILVPTSRDGRTSHYVLDLIRRTPTPLQSDAEAQLAVSSDGQRVWFFRQGTVQLACVNLASLHPVNLYLDRSVSSVFDIASDTGERAGIAIHARGTWGATVFDATNPNDATSSTYFGLLQGGF